MGNRIADNSSAEQISETSAVYNKYKKPLLQYIKIPIPELSNSEYDDKDMQAAKIINAILATAYEVNENNRAEVSKSGAKAIHADSYYTNKNISDSKKTEQILTRANLIFGEPTATVAFKIPEYLRDKIKTPTLNQMFSSIDPKVICAENLYSINYPIPVE